MNMTKAKDIRLAARVKRVQCDKALEELISRHTPLYCSIIRRMCKKYNNWHNLDELICEKEYVIYQSAMKFDKSKNIKFSTFIGNQAKWAYLNRCNKIQKTIKKETTFVENMSPQRYVTETSIEAQEAMEVSLGMLKKHPDKRIPPLFELRYKIGKNNKEMPWHLVGKEMGLSAQGCINLHNTGIKFLQNQFKKEGILC
jgi:DNA-directed RNA polymerase specialized sigma subunit